MTLNVGYKPNVFQGNGVIKEFAYDFNPISIQYLKVYFEEEGKWVEQLTGWNATVSYYGGLVTFDEPPTTRVQIARVINEEQPTSFKTSSGFDAKVVETSLDKLTGMIQQLQEASDRSVKVEVGDNQTPEELLEEVYEKLDSATEIAEDAIEAANQAQIAADNATQAVESAEETLREVTAYVDSAKIEINNTKETAIEEVDTKVTTAKADINSTVVTAQADITFTKDTAISAVESAVADLGTTVTQAKADITNTVEQGKSDIQGYIAESETEIREIVREEVQEAIADGKQEIEDYTQTVVKPELDSLVTSASESAVLASQKALESSNSATSASLASTQAHNSAVTAEEWARYAEGKVHPNWGYIGGDIETQADLMSKFDTIDDKIKEIELFKFPNAVIIGEPTIQNGQVSDFSTVSYLQFPFILDLHEKAFQIDMCFTTATNVQVQQNILDSKFGLALAIKDGKGLMAISSNGSSWDIGSVAGTQTLQSNTTYYARLLWNRLQYKTQISTDGVNYVDDMVITDTRRPYPTTIFIGGCDTVETGHTGHPFLGTINMNKCSLSVIGSVIWQGMDDAGLSTRADISLSNLDEKGEKRFTDKQDTLVSGTNIKTIGGNSLLGSGDIDVFATKTEVDNKVGNRVRKNITTLFQNGTLSTAIAAQNLEAYGITLGDYFTGASGYEYIIADYDTYYGGYNSYANINTHHVGLVVNTKVGVQWNTTDTTVGGYVASNLHKWLVETALPKIKTDLGTNHILSHQKLYSTVINASGYNRYGSNLGCSSSWAWSTDQMISALTESQVYGNSIWSSSGLDTGEAYKKLEVFSKFRPNQIFGNRSIWLRDIASSSRAAVLGSNGDASNDPSSYSRVGAALILFY